MKVQPVHGSFNIRLATGRRASFLAELSEHERIKPLRHVGKYRVGMTRRHVIAHVRNCFLFETVKFSQVADQIRERSVRWHLSSHAPPLKLRIRKGQQLLEPDQFLFAHLIKMRRRISAQEKVHLFCSPVRRTISSPPPPHFKIFAHDVALEPRILAGFISPGSKFTSPGQVFLHSDRETSD